MPAWVQAEVSPRHIQACLHCSFPFMALRFWSPRVCWDLLPEDPRVGVGGAEPAGTGGCSRGQAAGAGAEARPKRSVTGMGAAQTTEDKPARAGEIGEGGSREQRRAIRAQIL